MAVSTQQLLSNLQPWIGVESQPGPWFVVSQQDVDVFADVTRDHNPLHVDRDWAERESPFGATIAHGFFTLSLLSYLCRDIPVTSPDPYGDVINKLNYGFDRVRMVSPVRVGKRIRARRTLAEAAARKAGMVQVAHDVTVEIEEEDKPACTARWLTVLLCDP